MSDALTVLLFIVLISFLAWVFSRKFLRAKTRLIRIFVCVFCAEILLALIIAFIMAMTTPKCYSGQICIFGYNSFDYSFLYLFVVGIIAAPILIIESVIFIILMAKSRKLKNQVDNKVNKFKEEK